VPSACRPDDLEPEFGLHDGEYRLSPAQAQAILDLRLHRLTGLEHEKLLKEYQDKLAEIADLIDILEDPERLLQVIREELEESPRSSATSGARRSATPRKTSPPRTSSRRRIGW
jgi:DNA gyrase/topoisomerase IV subunit A